MGWRGFEIGGNKRLTERRERYQQEDISLNYPVSDIEENEKSHHGSNDKQSTIQKEHLIPKIKYFLRVLPSRNTNLLQLSSLP